MSQSKKTPFRFGEKIRTVRERKGYTLKVVAQRAGVSESLVSQIERNKVSPAIDTLLVLADVLDINLEFLFEEYRRERPVQIIHSQERRTVEEESIIYEELAKPTENDGNHSLESYIVKIPPNSQTLRGSYGHLGRELGFIITGKGQLHYESKVYDLEEGDSVSYSASSPHTLVNVGDETLTALWVVTPPQRFV
ncbi:MAG: helix-turn-helix transcriptional regulator [Treponema sp.]|jgi:transcriptional regulator with XRE-family HTH domain|nr:helix-turn-helix transcriptional regulator [Treponema sp.]